MNKSETIRFSVTPKMKGGLKLLFKGNRYSDVFELMVGSYIDNKVESYSVRIKSYESVLKELIYQKAVISEINRMKGIIKEITTELNYLIEIRSVCFNR